MRFARLALLVALLGVLLVACFARSQQVIQSGTIGTNEQVEHIMLRNVHVLPPQGNAYQPGDRAVARFELYNLSDQPDALLGARSGEAALIQLRWDRACDGDDEIVSRIPVLPEGPVPQPSEASAGSTPYLMEIVGLTKVIRPGTTLPITFVFERAGEATVDALVQVEGRYQPPSPPCPPTMTR